jgi:hypothetical protein
MDDFLQLRVNDEQGKETEELHQYSMHAGRVHFGDVSSFEGFINTF